MVPHSSPAAAVPPSSFVSQVVKFAQAGERQYKVPTSVSIAQAILESGWGDSRLTKEANNYFGIKCFSKDSPWQNGCYEIKTTEYSSSGSSYDLIARFRKYNSPERSFIDHGYFLNANPRYHNAFNYPGNPDRFAYEIHRAGYATDPGYTSSLVALMRQYNLYQYDLTPKNSTVLKPSTFGLANTSGTPGTTVKFVVPFYGDPHPKIIWQESDHGATWRTITPDSANSITNYGYRSEYLRTLHHPGTKKIRMIVQNSLGTTISSIVNVTTIELPVARSAG